MSEAARSVDFGAFYSEWWAYAFKCALREVGHTQDAEDVAQEALVGVWKAWDPEKGGHPGLFVAQRVRWIVGHLRAKPSRRWERSHVSAEAARLLPSREPTPETVVTAREVVVNMLCELVTMGDDGDELMAVARGMPRRARAFVLGLTKYAVEDRVRAARRRRAGQLAKVAAGTVRRLPKRPTPPPTPPAPTPQPALPRPAAEPAPPARKTGSPRSARQIPAHAGDFVGRPRSITSPKATLSPCKGLRPSFRPVPSASDCDSLASRVAFVCHGWEPTPLARRLGLHPESVRRYLHGQRPSPDFLAALCRELGVSAAWLLLGEGDPPPLAEFAA